MKNENDECDSRCDVKQMKSKPKFFQVCLFNCLVECIQLRGSHSLFSSIICLFVCSFWSEINEGILPAV